MPNLLLEIGTEELPASAIYSALEQMESLVPALMGKANLAFEESWTFATPRRLAITVRGVADRASAQVIRKKGPSLSVARSEDGSWTRAATGFAQAQGVEPDDLRIEESSKGSYVVAVTETEGIEAEDILSGLLLEIVSSLKFKKSMRWESRDERFSRPIRWFMAIFRDKIVEFEYAGLKASNITFGHRRLSGGKVTISLPRNYEHELKEVFVMADHRARLIEIVRRAERVCEEAGAVPVLDEDVLDEAVQLVEWPGVILGRFDERYLRLPREILVHAMKSHQRYLPVETKDGRLEASFVAIHNGNPDMANIIRKGHERVLAARLADAEFFFDEDSKRPLVDMLSDLEHVVYRSELGSMAEKSHRLARLIAEECAELGGDEELLSRSRRAAMLAKCDLVTHMVIEFPALQGTVGSIYARRSGEHELVAKAIHEQYLPRRLGDILPETVEGALLSLAEKADNLAASFGLGHVPTGSEDPYALRRQALGMMLILLDHGFAFSVSRLVCASASELEANAHGFAWTQDARRAFEEFFAARERVFFTERGYRYDLVEAALVVDRDVPLLVQRRLDALVEAREEGLLVRLYTAFERCHNLSRGQEAGAVSELHPQEPVEREVTNCLVDVASAVEGALATLDFYGALEALDPLCEPVNRLFDEVLIMAKDPAVRANRLSLLARIDALFSKVADFSKLMWD
ncbi:MAG: glycine--tRNA ligase subunit beta [Candidatus Anoxymicrobium japonicum]|uniref:Glycine--tRNA ligase beta subunit n=1 Tax=Candidatus Anoxymicrobium japonicum TaxID=2013648 RepID=A0A2N3G5A2_9ACTN|nr:MAG: glycine--tRNA ligase subunit beta [Candidatus Anoxymicrobium japonicum]